MRQEGLDSLGNHPCVMTEFGIPYDMDDKYAYKTGDYASQSAAMDANHYGVENAGLEGYTLWLYMTKVGEKEMWLSRVTDNKCRMTTKEVTSGMVKTFLYSRLMTSSYRSQPSPGLLTLTNRRHLC